MMANDVELRTPEDLNRYYDAIVAAVTTSLQRIREATPPALTTEVPSTSLPASSPPISSNAVVRRPLGATDGSWRPFAPMSPPTASQEDASPNHTYSSASPYVASTDFTFVAIARLGEVVLIAFRWRETGDEEYVHIVHLREFMKRNLAVDVADTVITTNLFERLGRGWYHQAPVRRIRGLTFIE